MGRDTAYIVVGKIGAPHGVRGWVKIHSFTEPPDNLFEYSPWYLSAGKVSATKASSSKPATQWRAVDFAEAREQGKGFIARFEGCNDRDAAALLTGQEIAVRREQLPELEEGQYYWIDLEGLEVKTLEGQSLGVLDHMMDTGANDVMVVKGERERLIPYVMGPIVKEVDIAAGFIRVDWSPDYD